MMKRRSIVAGVLVLTTLAATLVCAQKTPAPDRKAVQKAMQNGNWKNAYDAFAKLALDPASDDKFVGDDLLRAVQCLQNLGRSNEIDPFREKVIAVHPKNWRLLESAAQTFYSNEHYGFMIAGKFERGNHRGGGKAVNSMERDRVRSMQLMVKAQDLVGAEADKKEAGNFYLRFADMVLNGLDGQGAWRLQELTDLTTLPDYADGYYGYGRRGGFGYGGMSRGGAPVNEDGTPVFYKMPKTWADAKNDGERWRFLLMQAMEMDASRTGEARMKFATFLDQQFGVRTMAYSGGRMFGRPADDSKKDESGPYAVSTLKNNETIAQLATGIKRFELPDEFNFIKLYKQIADENKGPFGEQALNGLAQTCEDRQQYDPAADVWKRCVAEYHHGQERLDQIVGNWGQFEQMPTQASGKDAKFDFRFRNAKSVSFEAYEIDYRKLLDDVKAYLKSNPQQLAWDKIAIDNIGYQLVQEKQKQYLGKQVAKWDLPLEPRTGHYDKRITVTAPIKQSGAYFVRAKLEGGNEGFIVLWLADTALVKKAIDGGSYYFVADAVTGEPVAKATVEFFGYEQRHIKDRQFQVITDQFAEGTDADGQVILKNRDPNQRMNWLITATDDTGRLATLGFSSIWQPHYPDYDQVYNQTKIFGITDRPVYRPGQSMKWKTWVAKAQYDQQAKSPFAGQSLVVKILNPKGDKILEKGYTLDEYGGIDGEFPLPKDTTLGVYNAQCFFNGNYQGGFNFRVEEYKKPEFEVKVDAPSEPVMLGEKITATISAKYYFGGTVTNANVKYKITRQVHNTDWYPIAKWDWMYGRGYWWFACDYNWYPGFNDWGMKRPMPIWWNRPQAQPEIVSERELPIGEDGTVKVEIDTAVAKAIHGDLDHEYTISAEITDQSRRTISGSGSVMVARKPFKVFAWIDRGYYRAGDAVEAFFKAQTLDNKGVQGKGELKLLKITYDKDMKPTETDVQKWSLDTDAQGEAKQQMKAAQPGQYRLSYSVTDAKNHTIEGGYLFNVRGENFTGKEYRFNDIELITQKREYRDGDKIELMINTNRSDAVVALFLRPVNGVYLPPRIVRMKGKSTVQTIDVTKKDMPNFFVEAFTISDGKLFEETKEVVVPPESRILNVEVSAGKKEFKPGEKTKLEIKLTDPNGEPFVGSTVISVYDKAVEYISGGSNVGDIKEFFWKWRRNHYPRSEVSLSKAGGNMYRPNTPGMQFLGAFGSLVADLQQDKSGALGLREEQMERSAAAPMTAMAPGSGGFGDGGNNRMMLGRGMAMDGVAKGEADRDAFASDKPGANGIAGEKRKSVDGGAETSPDVQPAIRKNFADTALWVGNLETNKNGMAEVELTMPENLSTWKTKVWAMGSGTQVGQGETELVTTKDLIVRLQAPRFFVQKDEVVLSANVHNYLKNKKTVKVSLELQGGTLRGVGNPDEVAKVNPGGNTLIYTTSVEIEPKGEKRVDWTVKVIKPGEAIIRMKALTDEDSDAMEMKFPVYVHGMLKTESFAGAMKVDQASASLTFNVPNERNPAFSRLEVRYSPTLAMAMVDALPYLADYPYGCTEQTLNRFVPTVITQKVLLDMKLNLAEIRAKRTNLNAQEIGNDVERAAGWKRFDHNPVFDEAEVASMVKDGMAKLTAMQLNDGGWGWFSGFGEQSWPHTTAVVVHGLQVAKSNDAAIVPGVMERGVQWLVNYQNQQVQMLKNAASKTNPWKEKADNVDALVYMVLVDGAHDNRAMRDFLYRDRNDLAVYSKAMVALACHKINDFEKRDMLIKNCDQYLVQDAENQTAYLKLPENNYWWCWYGSDVEAMGYYLKLLALTDPKSEKASGLAKYLVNNRKHSTYWNSTRDTAIVIEALADYIRASGENNPDISVEVLVDGKSKKTVSISAANLFSYDNKLVMTGDEITTGQHKVEFRKQGNGPLYFNAYATNFTMEDDITKAGLEIKVNRKFYKLKEVDKKVSVSGSRGQAVKQNVEKYERTELNSGDTLKSGDLVEIEMEIDSKNDYEYILFEDMKAAGFEPMELRSGYNGNDMHAYMELHDERVCFFVRALARGKHSVSYRMRAEIPGKFSALPTKASAMYAPELKANSDEIKLNIKD